MVVNPELIIISAEPHLLHPGSVMPMARPSDLPTHLNAVGRLLDVGYTTLSECVHTDGSRPSAHTDIQTAFRYLLPCVQVSIQIPSSICPDVQDVHMSLISSLTSDLTTEPHLLHLW